MINDQWVIELFCQRFYEPFIHAKLYKEAINLLLSKSQEFPDTYELQKYLYQLYAQNGDYPNAILIGVRYIDFVPSDTEFFYFLSTCYREVGEYSNGISIAERLRLRQPNHIKNLIILADLYSHSKNFQRAEELLQHSLKVEPENSSALSLREVIRKRKNS